MIYLDSSALLKLLWEEHESASLERWLLDHTATPTVSSELAKIEVVRACRRRNHDVVPEARALLAGLDLIPMSSDVVEHAAEIGEPPLRSLDAIHLASALAIRADLSVFLGYDQRLLDAASAEGLEPVSPGR
ncbi:MAG: type II toxin-antitoxin system VapC family toxin [Streptomycetales bacterium]